MAFDPAAAIVTLTARFEGNADRQFILQVKILTAILAVSFFVSLASMLLRWRASAFWVVRMNAGIIQPHSLIGFLLTSSVFYLVAIPYLWLTRGSGDPVTVQNGFSFRSLLFIPLWFGVYSMAIATMVAPLSIQSQKRQIRHPFLLNFFILSIPILFLSSLLTITVLGHYQNAALFRSYLSLVDLLQETPIQAVAAIAANSQMTIDSARIIERWKNVWTIYSVFIGIALAIFLASSANYFKILVQSIKTIRESQGSSAKLSALGRAYTSLIITTITTALIAILYLVLTCFVAITLGSTSNKTNLFSLASVWIFAFFGGITNLVILIRSILIYRNSSFSGGTLESKSHHSASRPSTAAPVFLPLHKLRGSSSNDFITITREWEVKVESEVAPPVEQEKRFEAESKKAGLYSVSNRSEGGGWMMAIA